MAYTPDLSRTGCATLRRMAWAGSIPMTKAIDEAILILSGIMDKTAVCAECERRNAMKCETCFFNEEYTTKF